MKSLPLLAILALIIQTLSADTAINSLGGTSPVVYVDAGSLSDPYYNFYFVENSNENKGTVGEGYIPLKIASNETMSLIVGETYIFRRLNDQTSHPFFVTDDSNGGMPSSKITLKAISSGNSYPWPSSSNGAAGLVEMEVTINDTFDPSTDSLYFICTSHPSMKDTFNTVTAANINTGSYGLGLKPNGLETSGSYNTSWPSGSPWTTALRLFESEDADSANEHTLKINVTSLGSGTAHYRLARTNLGGNFWYQNAQTLTEGVNTIPIGGVSFPRDIVIHFKNQAIGISSIELNGNLLAGFDPMPVIIPDAINDVPSGSVLADASQGFGSISSAGFTRKKSIYTNNTDDKVAMGGTKITYYVTKVSDETLIRTVKATTDNVAGGTSNYYASVPSYINNTIVSQDCIDSAVDGTYSLKEIEAFQSDDDSSNDTLTDSDTKGDPSPNGLKIELYIPGVTFNNRTIALQHSRIIAIDQAYGVQVTSTYDEFDEAAVAASGNVSPFTNSSAFTPTTNEDFPYSFEGVNMSTDPDAVTIVLDNVDSQGVITFNINVTHMPNDDSLVYDIIKSSEGGWSDATGDGTNQNQTGTLVLGENIVEVVGSTYPRSVRLRVSAPFGYSSAVATSDADLFPDRDDRQTAFNDSVVFENGSSTAHPYIYRLGSSDPADSDLYTDNQSQKRIFMYITGLPEGGATYNISKTLENPDADGNIVYDVAQSGVLTDGLNAILLKSSTYDRTSVLRISDNIEYNFFGYGTGPSSDNNSQILYGTAPSSGNIASIEPPINFRINKVINDDDIEVVRLLWNNPGMFLKRSTDLNTWEYVSSGDGEETYETSLGSSYFYQLDRGDYTLSEGGK
jgi:hypothetical protein